MPSRLQQTLLSGVEQLASQTPVCVPRVAPVALEPVAAGAHRSRARSRHGAPGKHHGKHHGHGRGRLSTYRVDREIGRGGMAVVYAGWHEQLERPVALKVLASHLAGDEHFRTRFLREARIASKLHHPNLVRTYDIAELDGSPCIVMELLPGGTLEGAQLTRPAAAEVASGLAHAHAQGVVHRDLKPANLLRAADGVVKIADFGIARAVEETRVTQIGTVLGTLRYLAPEQAEGREVGPEADVYSLGVVLDELLASPSHADRGPDRALPATRPARPADRPGGRSGVA